MFPLLCFAALGIDIAHIYVVRNELQNAADAGALAGARFLYCCEDDTECSVTSGVNVEANERAYLAATANLSDNTPVEVNWGGGNSGDVERGHWSFATQTFTPNDSTAAVDLWDVSEEELDNNLNFINAVRVKARREATPAESFFAGIIGYDGFELSAEAVAYRGYAGNLYQFDVDQPIVICEDSIRQNNEYSCNIGRMINSGQNVENNETGGWTNFNQINGCQGGTNAGEVSSLICGEGNPETLILGDYMGTNGGQIQSAFSDLISCWERNSGNKTQPWNITLPVVDCPDNNINVCQVLRGAVNLNVIWITGAGNDPGYNNAPRQMGEWSSTDPDGIDRWNSFVQYFNLQNVNGTPAPYANKSIYFLPDCTPHAPIGGTGGSNFGVMACIPVLVE